MADTNQWVACLLIAATASAACTCATAAQSQRGRRPVLNAGEDRMIALLDENSDGAIDPYEAADAIKSAVAEFDANRDGRLDSPELRAWHNAVREGAEAEFDDLLDEYDEDDNGRLSLREFPEDEESLFLAMDRNRDDVVTRQEATSLRGQNPSTVINTAALREEVRELLRDLDRNSDRSLTADELDDTARAELAPADFDRDQRLTPEELLRFLRASDLPFEFAITGNVATMEGLLDASVAAKVMRLIVEHPKVDTIVMQFVPGSVGDNYLRAARLIHAHGFTTVIPANGLVASGGTDFFLAGTTRIVHAGASIGVHSWGEITGAGSDLDRNDEAHRVFLEFFRAIDIDPGFYWFTLKAAPAGGMHDMTRAEMERFGVGTIYK